MSKVENRHLNRLNKIALSFQSIVSASADEPSLTRESQVLDERPSHENRARHAGNPLEHGRNWADLCGAEP